MASERTFDVPAGKASVAAAALLLTGGTAVGVASGALSGGGDGSTATAAEHLDSASKGDPGATKHQAVAPKRERPAAPSASSSTSAVTTTTVARKTTGSAQMNGVISATPAAAQALTPPPPPKPKHAKTRPVAAHKAAAHRKGGGIVALQNALGIPVDGDFGPRTQRALKSWQKKHGMTPDGVLGPQTRSALKLGPGKILKRKGAKRARRVRAHRRVVAAGNRHGGGGVKSLQRALGLTPDGDFGPSTEKALKHWQKAHGLPADGVAGPATRKALGMGPGRVLKRKGGGGHGRRRGGTHTNTGGGGGSSSVVQRVVAAANRIATTPYTWGGGHGSFQSSGYDCSGSVSYALHGGGLLSSPLDSSALMSYGSPGPGKYITIYANSGHAWMTINGRRFDTSARSESGSRWGGPRSGSGYTVRHPTGY